MTITRQILGRLAQVSLNADGTNTATFVVYAGTPDETTVSERITPSLAESVFMVPAYGDRDWVWTVGARGSVARVETAH